MGEAEFTTPSAPFMEIWGFEIVLSSIVPASDTPGQIRNSVVAHLRGVPSDTAAPEFERDAVREEIREIVASRLSSPDYRYFIIEFEEKPGSLIAAFSILAVIYGGVAGYGSFRKGLDYVYEDLKAIFRGIQGINAKVKRIFKERDVLIKPRTEPTFDVKRDGAAP
jgi:hypothetical protein